MINSAVTTNLSAGYTDLSESDPSHESLPQSAIDRVAADVQAEERRYTELQILALDYAREGETLALDRMISAGLPINLRNGKGHTLLMLAAYHGHAETVAMLLERGANPDARNDRGQTPLGGAAFKGHDEVVKTLLDHGANPKADQGYGLTPAGYAMMFGRFRTARLIRKHASFLRRRDD